MTNSSYQAKGFTVNSVTVNEPVLPIRVSFVCPVTQQNHILEGTIALMVGNLQVTCADCNKELAIDHLHYPDRWAVPTKTVSESHAISVYIYNPE